MLMFSSVPVVPVIPRQSLGWPGLTDMLVPAASLFLLPGLVVGFTFPGDWHKIRQMMEARREAEAENDGGLLTRGNFVFDDETLEEEIDWNTFQFSTTTTTPPKPQPMPLEAIMADLMAEVNMTEVLMRFGSSDQGGLSMRNAFNMAPEPPPAFSASNAIWNFTMTLVERGLLEPTTGNALFSPVSILTTINMLLLGTVGQTRREILEALGYPRYTSDVHQQFQNIIKSMNRDIGVTVATSNSLFHQVDFNIKESYKQELLRNYGSEISLIPVDFTNRPRTTLRRVNGFIAQNTNNLIRNMFKEPLSVDTKVVLSNALYFNGSWEYEFLFDPPDFVGIESQFHSFNKHIPITLMEATFDYPYYKDEENMFEMISLPYEHDVRNEEISEAHMFLILPSREGKEAFEDVERKLQILNFEEVFDRMGVVFGDIFLPRMEMDFSANLGPFLSDMGINKLFSGNPSRDFSPMTDSWQDFKLNTLQHKAVLRITEKGTEAAAATSAFLFRMSPFTSLTFDRPFFLFIYDALNKVVIFWARVVEPKAIELN